MVEDAGNHPLVRLFTSKKTSSPVPLLEQPQAEEQGLRLEQGSEESDGPLMKEGPEGANPYLGSVILKEVESEPPET